MLSSQPLAFGIAGMLRAHRGAAIAVLAHLVGRDLAGFTEIGRAPWRLEGLDAEWAPEPDDHLKDRSAADVAAAVPDLPDQLTGTDVTPVPPKRTGVTSVRDGQAFAFAFWRHFVSARSV